MRKLMCGFSIVLMTLPVSAQEISPEADRAMWCASAITLLDVMGVYPPEATNAVAVARQWSRKAFQEFDAAGYSEETVSSIIKSYNDELSMQLPDYLVSDDAAALRLDIHACFVR